MTSLASEGLGNLPGLIITVAVIFIFFGIFLPRDNQWFLVLFIATEIGVSVAYILLNRRSRRESEEMQQALHTINEQDHQVR
jgi:low affinity Fe/Cu permease